jgi:hypothetical protein
LEPDCNTIGDIYPGADQQGISGDVIENSVGCLMNISVLFVACCILLGGFSAEAAEAPAAQPAKKEVTTEQLKATIIGDIDARMKLLQASRACVMAAKSKDDIKKCADKAGERRKELKKTRGQVRRELQDKGN